MHTSSPYTKIALISFRPLNVRRNMCFMNNDSTSKLVISSNDNFYHPLLDYRYFTAYFLSEIHAVTLLMHLKCTNTGDHLKVGQRRVNTLLHALPQLIIFLYIAFLSMRLLKRPTIFALTSASVDNRLPDTADLILEK